MAAPPPRRHTMLRFLPIALAFLAAGDSDPPAPTKLHLDDPLHLQVGRYVAGVVQGDLSTNYITQCSILDDLVIRFPPRSASPGRRCSSPR